METLWQDVKYGARQLARNPGFTAVAVLTLALSVGANTSIFSVVNGLLLSPLPYPEPDRLMRVYATQPAQGWNNANVNPIDVHDWAAQSRLFQEMALYDYRRLNLTGLGEPEQVQAAAVEANLLPLLGASPSMGRSFRPEEDRPGAAHVALLTHGFWQRAFAGDPAVLGRNITLNGGTYTVVGVLGPDFTFFYEPVDLLLPLALDLSGLDRGPGFLEAIGQLKPGVSRQEAQAELDAIAGRNAKAYPDTEVGWGIRVTPLYDEIFDPVLRLSLAVLMVGVTAVLLIGCVNVANLLLSRAATRGREMAIRAAHGAGRTRLVRQLLTESLLLASLGGIAGLMVAVWGVEILRRMVPPEAPRGDHVQMDAAVLLYGLGVALLTSLFFGLVPAWQATRVDVQEALKEGSRTTSGASRHRLLKSLVTAEVALALLLLSVGALMVRSFQSLTKVDPGFQIDNLLTARLSLPESKYEDDPQRVAFFRDALEKVRAVPGIRSASAVATLPLSGSSSWARINVEGTEPARESEPIFAGRMVVTPGYFDTLGVKLLSGRDLGPGDTAEAPRVIVVNQTMAQRFWPGNDPVGRRLSIVATDSPQRWMTVIGVVHDIRHQNLNRPPRPEMFLPHAQVGSADMALLVRTDGDPLAYAAALREQVWAVDSDQPVSRIRTMTAIVDQRLVGPRASAQTMSFLALVALALAAVGVYGVISYSVSERTHEIGLRMALGATPGNVFQFVLRQGMLPIGIGGLLGLAGAFGAARSMKSILFGVSPSDPSNLLLTAGLLLVIAGLACYLPARRAMRVDPMTALRYE